MRAVVQRVIEASVSVDGAEKGRIGRGFMVLVGVSSDDNEADAEYLADKVAKLRVFEDSEGKMNLSLLDIGGEVLAVSQFTLYGDARKGNRPGFTSAAPPDKAEALYRKFVDVLKTRSLKVEEGVFRAHMKVHLVNDGPVTIILDSKKLF
jgi:D-tyrosyl-tRNA(Tyr) deacylase